MVGHHIHCGAHVRRLVDGLEQGWDEESEESKWLGAWRCHSREGRAWAVWTWPEEVVEAAVEVCRQDVFWQICETWKCWCQQSLGCGRVEFRAEFCDED